MTQTDQRPARNDQAQAGHRHQKGTEPMKNPQGFRIAGAAFAGVAVGAVATALFLPGAPTSCDVALDAAEEIFAVHLDLSDDMTTYFEALSYDPLDWRATEQFTGAVVDATDRINSIDYATPAANCRGTEG